MSEISTQNFVEQLAGRGVYHMTPDDLANARGSSLEAARAALARLRSRGVVAMPYKGFFVFVPPEYRSLECLPAEQFLPQLMAYLKEPYYVGLLSAAAYHGAAHQAIQTFQAIVTKNRKPLSCGKVRIEFIAKLNIEQAPTQAVNTPRSLLRISTPEMTALDLVGYYHRSGGLDHVATILKELGEKIGPQKLLQASETSPLPWVQRLAYLLTLVGFESKTRLLQKFIESKNAPVTPLLPGTPMSGSEKDRQFRVAINTEVEPDQ